MTIQRKRLILILALLCLPVLATIALLCGRIIFSINTLITVFTNPAANPLASNVIFQLRLPRVIGALLIGAALASSGIAFQNLFQNPLVSPDLLGVSYGASVGAALAIILGLSIWTTQCLALVGGILAVTLTLIIPRLIKQHGTLILVLAGIIVSGFMQAIIGLLKYIADPDSQLQSIVYWQLGSIAKVDLTSISAVLPMMIIGFGLILILRWHLTVLSLGDLTAMTQGINVTIDRLLIILGATLLTAASVCLSGTIGWVGLVIPHIARTIIGEDSRYALPMAACCGAGFLLIIDTLARTISMGEIPLSILTGFIGAPIFIYILVTKKVLVK